MTNWESILADAILLLHFAFIVFVVGGQVCVMAGFWCRWRWVRNMTFRVLHLAAILYVVIQAWLGKSCPLTIWEKQLRTVAGEPTYSESFIEHWVGQLVFYQAPSWVFTLVYSIFSTLVVASWVWVRPSRAD